MVPLVEWNLMHGEVELVFSAVLLVLVAGFSIAHITTKKMGECKNRRCNGCSIHFCCSLSGLIGMGVSGQLDLDLDLLDYS